jgi:hypothetical protein
VGLRTLVDFERGARSPHGTTLEALQQALEAAGVIFIAENGEGPGVRLKKERPDEGKRPDELNAENDG